MALAWAALAAAVIGAGSQAYGANKAAGAQTTAAGNATALQSKMFDTTQKNLQPFITGGQGSFNNLLALTGNGPGGNPLTAPLTKPFNPTMTDLENTPGYKFALDQGLKSTQNSYAAQGLGSSGAALRGAADYSEGLASTTYQQQFQNYLDQNKQIGNLLLAPSQLGEAAGANLGGVSANVGSQIGSNLLGVGNAQAGADIATGNSVANGASSAVNNYTQMSLLQRLIANGGSGTGTGGSGVLDPNGIGGSNWQNPFA